MADRTGRKQAHPDWHSLPNTISVILVKRPLRTFVVWLSIFALFTVTKVAEAGPFRDFFRAVSRSIAHPEAKPRTPYVSEVLQKRPSGPVVAASDYMKTFADQIRPFIPQGRVYRVLGTDGFGRSDSRAKLRHFFEVNRWFVTIAALKALAEQGEAKPKSVADAIRKYGIDPEKADPTTV